MNGKYYFVARPETLVSVVRVGKLRENLPDWLAIDKMVFFDDVNSAVKSSTTSLNQTFIIEMIPPKFDETNLLTKQFNKESNERSICADQIETDWISHIYVYSQQGYKLASRLLNNESPITITIKPEIFVAQSQKTQYEQSHVTSAGFFSDTAIAKDKTNMTYLKRGDLLGSNMQTLINTVNTVGVMGKGIALSFKTQYPEMFTDYLNKCKQGIVKIGQPYLYKVSKNRWIINFPTKQDWKNPSKLEYIEDGLKYLANHLQEWGITSLAIPPLGCGNGQLDWNDIQPLIDKYLGNSQIPIEIYAPFIQESKNTTRLKRRRNTTIKKESKRLKQEDSVDEFSKEIDRQKDREYKLPCIWKNPNDECYDPCDENEENFYDSEGNSYDETRPCPRKQW